MSDHPLHFALRETLRHLGDARVLTIMAVVGVILGFSGPFGTFDVLPLVPRVIYWIAVVVATYGIGVMIATLAHRQLRDRVRPWLRVLLTGLCIGLPVTALVIGINLLTFGPGGWQAIDPLLLLINVTLVALGVTAIAEIVAQTLRPGPVTAGPVVPAPATPAILERLPVHLRGPLLALSVQDHYVEVLTARGKDLVLIRLSDAIRETAPVAGLQIHRSHWVALNAVSRVSRSNGKVSVVLATGQTLPVSRGYMDAARAAGLVV